MIAEDITLVGSVVIISGHMYADLFLRCEVHGHTDLGSYIESPVTIVNLQHVHVGRHLTIAST